MYKKQGASKGAEASLKKASKKPVQSAIKPVECFVSKVISFSSQYNTSGWGANQVIGEPRVYPRYGDLQGSWAPRDCTQEYLEVEFPEELFINAISIYETYNAGAVTDIGAWDSIAQCYVPIYHGTPRVIGQSRIFEPNIENLNFKCNQLRIDIDCTLAGTWCEIDAIKIKGLRHNIPLPPPNSLSTDLVKLVNNEKFSDVCFIVEKKRIYAHKAILTIRSDYFNAMFTGKMKESDMNEIMLEDVKYDIFLSLLEYVYTGQLTCDPVITVELLKLADMFSMDDLKMVCAARIPEHLTINTVLGVLAAVAQGDSFGTIRDICHDFIAKNYSQVTMSKEFQSLAKDEILEIVQLTATRLRL